MDSSRIHLALAVTLTIGLLVACGGSTADGSNPTAAPAASEDERGSVGVPPTAAEYCTKLGFVLTTDSQCKFPDGTACEEWAFYRGQCGQKHSYCNQHGGSISSKTVDMGTWTAVYGVCALNGVQCEESSFVQSGKCP